MSPPAAPAAMAAVATLEDQLIAEGVELDANNKNEYHPMISLMEIMMGYKPKLNALCNLWPPGFRTFHLMFKNSLGLPVSMMGRPPLIRDLFLAMLASSREEGCEYCTAHTTAAAFRRGVQSQRIRAGQSCSEEDEEAIQQQSHCREQALDEMARALSRSPPELTEDHLLNMQTYYCRAEIERAALCVSLMGLLTLLADAFGLRLEQTALEEATAVMGNDNESSAATSAAASDESKPSSRRRLWKSSDSFRIPQGQTATMVSPRSRRRSRRLSRRSSQQSNSVASSAEECSSSISSDLPPQDTISTYIRMATHGPQALYVETVWLAGVPSTCNKARSFLEHRIGYNFPILSSLDKAHRGSSMMMTYTAILRDHFDEQQSAVGCIVTKALVGLVSAAVAGDDVMTTESRTMVLLFAALEQQKQRTVTLDRAALDRIVHIATREPLPKTQSACEELIQRLAVLLPARGYTTKECRAAVLILARAVSERPVPTSDNTPVARAVPPLIVQHAASLLTPAARLETIMWVGLQRCFQRIRRFAQMNERVDRILSSYLDQAEKAEIEAAEAALARTASQSRDDSSEAPVGLPPLPEIFLPKQRRHSLLDRLFRKREAVSSQRKAEAPLAADAAGPSRLQVEWHEKFSKMERAWPHPLPPPTPSSFRLSTTTSSGTTSPSGQSNAFRSPTVSREPSAAPSVALRSGRLTAHC